jgi:hypothetical protein
MKKLLFDMSNLIQLYRHKATLLNGTFDLANLAIKLANVIFAILAPLAGLPFVTSQGIVILLLDVGVPAHGLKVVPP